MSHVSKVADFRRRGGAVIPRELQSMPRSAWRDNMGNEPMFKAAATGPALRGG
jgi:hypothetical protein